MTNPHLTLEGVSYVLPDGRALFSDINAQFDRQPTGLAGRNGVGKSVLARIAAGELRPTAGRSVSSGSVHYLCQQFDARRHPTVSALAGTQSVMQALRRIESGSVAAADFETVGDRWDIHQRLAHELEAHGLGHLQPDRPVTSLSGGEAMRVALVGAFLANADFLILDEPTNPLDRPSRRALLEQLQRWSNGLLVVSHDRELLEQMPRIVELSSLGLRSYGGNYSFYAQCKTQERADAQRQLDECKLERKREEQALRVQRERHERRNAHGDRNGREANQARIMLGRKKERSESTSAKLQVQQATARERLSQRVREAALRVEETPSISMTAPISEERSPGRLVELDGVELPFVSAHTRHLSLSLHGPRRVGVVGPNGCGKSTLLRLLAGDCEPLAGTCDIRGPVAYLDQQLSSLDSARSVLEQLKEANPKVSESVLRTRLAQLGLGPGHIQLPSAALSGGERIKAALACALYAENSPRLLLLDEPSNHLDLASAQALEVMLDHYRGALLVVSHDEVFLQQLGLTDRLEATPEGWAMTPW